MPYLTAAGEAEAQCANLLDSGIAYGVITDDSDVLLFGDRINVYKNVFNSKKYIERYTSRAISSNMKLDRDRLILLAMLLGSDYTEGLV